jgi:Protein of unknown function (DUF2946)
VGFRSMRWLCSNRRPWAWVALLALTLQLGLAFGHFHGLHAVQPTLTATTAAGNTAPSHTNGGDQDDADYCGNCAILALLTGAQTASAPVVAPPAAPATKEVTFLVEAAYIDSRCAAFRSRAPPVS